MFEELWTPITESFKTTKLDKKNLTLRRSFLLASDRFFLRNFGKFSHNVRRVMDTYYGEF